MSDPAIIEAIRHDAGLFLHQLDLIQRRALFVRVGEQELRNASFLDERLLNERIGVAGRDAFWLPLDPLFDEAVPTQEGEQVPGFIFHIGHCGSTLLSRLLDLSPDVLGLREPLALRQVAATELDRDAPFARIDPARFPALFAWVLHLLGRRFRSDQQIVIKATSSCNNLVAPLLAGFPDARIVLLHLPLESYLATLLKAPGGGRDALTFAVDRLHYLNRYLGGDDLHLYRLNNAETLALGWVAELARFQQIARSTQADHAMMLDFEVLLEALDAGLVAVREHLGLGVPAASSSGVAQVLRAYAKKPDHAYSPVDRAHDLDLSRRKFGSEIARGMAWAEQLIARHRPLASLVPLLRAR
ncbi:MAG: hypothetical protein WBW61_10860 [Rhodanobacteraceae bacterium]